MSRQDAPRGPRRSSPSSRMDASAPARLAALLAPVVAGVGVDLEDVAVVPAGGRRLVRVVVDADSGIDLDRVADVSRAVSAALDAPDADTLLGGAPYVLEVSSPGTDRPLQQPRHWRRATGRLVAVRRHDGTEVHGRVQEAAEDAVTLDVPDAEPEVVLYRDVARAVVEVEFHRRDSASASDSDIDIDIDIDGEDDGDIDADSDGHGDGKDGEEEPWTST